MTPIEIQNIVDGECSHEDRCKLLGAIGDDAQAWRRLALALIEEQEFSRQIGATNYGDQHFGRLTAIAPKMIASPLVSQPVQGSRDERTADSWTRYARPLLPALAASVLVLIGFWGGAFLERRTSELTADRVPTSAIERGAMLATTKPPSLDGMKMLWPNIEGTEIPLYDLSQVDPTEMWAKEDYEFALANEQLRRRGFELDVRPELYTGTLNDGRRLVVPVKHVGLKPYGQ
jgi:hypothetical protein